MDVKEAVKWIFDMWHEWENVYGVSGEISLEEGKKMDEVIELLQRGEKFEFIFSDMHYAIQHMLDKTYFYNIKTPEMTDAEYIDKAFEIIEQKYFPKEVKANETQVAK